MLTKHFSSMRAAVLLAAVCTASAVQAGVTPPPPPFGAIDYAPGVAASVPTLGAWALVLLALLFGAVAYRLLRARMGGRLLANLLLVGGVAAAGVAGSDLVQQAQAVEDYAAALGQAAGGTTNVGIGETKVTNTSGVTQRITNLRLLEEPASVDIRSKASEFPYDWTAPEEMPRCQAGMSLAPADACYVRIVWLTSDR